MFMFLQNSYVGNLTPKVVLLGGGGLWEVIRTWEWSPHEWDSCPYKRVSTGVPCKDIKKSLPHGRKPSSNHAGTLILDFWPPELWEINTEAPPSPQLMVLCYSSRTRQRHTTNCLSKVHTGYSRRKVKRRLKGQVNTGSAWWGSAGCRELWLVVYIHHSFSFPRAQSVEWSRRSAEAQLCHLLGWLWASDPSSVERQWSCVVTAHTLHSNLALHLGAVWLRVLLHLLPFPSP